jgi:outer membrane protein
LAFFAGVAHAETLKIGIVDFRKVFDNSKAGEAVKQELDAAGQKVQGELQKRKEEIDESRKNLERESMIMSQDARADREREIRIKINDFKAMQKQYMEDLQERQQQLIRQIEKEVFELAEQMGKEMGFSLILEKRASAALYFDPSLDITDQLIERFDKMSAQTTGKTE